MPINYFRSKNTNGMMKKVYPHVNDEECVRDTSRNGDVLRFEGLSVMEYTQPWETVNFHIDRDMNPFFTVMQIAWMLAGRRDVNFLNYFNSNMKNYSDDGVNFNAAYGYRLRYHFGFDQLEAVIKILRKDPTTRQAVCQIWCPSDLGANTLDKAYNMQLVFSLQPNTRKLDMIIYNRSNDSIWGAVSGTNPAHFGAIHQYVANGAILEQGSMYQVSANLHTYLDNPKTPLLINRKIGKGEFYANYNLNELDFAVTTYKYAKMLEDLRIFFGWFDTDPRFILDYAEKWVTGNEGLCLENMFVNQLCVLFAAYTAYKNKDYGKAIDWCDAVCTDWSLRCVGWLNQREKNRNKK